MTAVLKLFKKTTWGVGKHHPPIVIGLKVELATIQLFLSVLFTVDPTVKKRKISGSRYLRINGTKHISLWLMKLLMTKSITVNIVNSMNMEDNIKKYQNI